MAQTFTRQQFYDLVWSKPMTHLAKDFGISDVALHKICRKHNIPNPPLGWWAKKAAGKKVRQTPLPEPEADAVQSITLADPELRNEPPGIAAAREQARIAASATPADSDLPRVPIIERTLARLEKAKPSEVGISTVDGPGLIKCSVAPSSTSRLGIILPRIVQAAAIQGFDLVADSGPAHFRSQTEEIAFSISETVKREKHVLTDAERAKEEAWSRKQEQAAKRNSWHSVMFGGPRFPEWDYLPTGLLSLELEHVYGARGYSPRRTFRDAKVQRLENMSSEIAVGLAVLAAAKTEERLRRAEQQRKAEEEQQRREAIARRRHIEERRITELESILSQVQEIDRVRNLVGMLEAMMADVSTPRVSVFLEWRRVRLEQLESHMSPDAIEKRFSDERLFGEDDDHAFRYSRW